MSTNELMPPPIAPVKRSTPKKKEEENAPESTITKSDAEPATKEIEKTETKETGTEKTETKEIKETKETKETKEKEREKNTNPDNVELLYSPPEWSSPNKYQFHLDVLKNGSIVETIDLSKKDHLLIGRLPICDITFDHPSVSRQHAVIQNRDSGALYIYDLGSTHKTVVNKRPIPPKVHYVVRIGDVIKIGQSSRQFIVGGTEEVEKEQRDTVERQRADFLRKKIENQIQIKTYTPLIDLFAKKDSSSTISSLRGDTASWGMDFDDDAVYAADNPEEEVFIGNDEDAEDYIKKGKKDAKKSAQQHKKREKRVDDDEEDSGDDEFFDRTKHKSDVGIAKVETYESLVAKKEEFAQKKDELQKELRAVRNTDSLSNEEDSLDAFMNTNSESILDDKRSRIKAKIAEIEKEQVRVDKLIKLAAPALQPAPKKAVEKTEKPSDAKTETKAENGNKGSVFTAPAPREKYKRAPIQKLDADIPEEFKVKPMTDAVKPKAKIEGEIEEEREQDGKDNDEKKDETMEEKEEKGEGEEKTESGKSRTAIKRERQREKHKQRDEDERKRKKLEEFESKYDAWVPPNAQSGDGRTKLNDLYGY